ncbi:hypothetical protein LR69_04576 [Geobacillus sp. BCO2]|nr:hypothetical protein LR69_04576 [Geobacillus sp. BCO2]
MKTKLIKLSKETNSELTEVFLRLQNNPYKNYMSFKNEVSTIISKNIVPKELIEICNTIRTDRESGETYAHLIQNCPIDPVRPVFDHNDPVTDKYQKKTTFVGEGFLELFAQLTDMPLLAYETRNNGDFFHDVYAHSKYYGTQTQKTDSELFYHNDRTAHSVRADYLALLGMRSHEQNRIYTGYIDGRAILKFLNEHHQSILRQPYFFTPFDDYSRDSNKGQVVSQVHPILENYHSFRYYDTRTTYIKDAPVEAKEALLALKDAIIKTEKDHIHIKTGDLFVFPNQDGLHNREIIEIAFPEEAKNRWILKTYNFSSTKRLKEFSSYFHENIPGLVKEIVTVK